jgi:catechol 2,3-dioxygenase-like lactoylglutathione lyase family enzyme
MVASSYSSGDILRASTLVQWFMSGSQPSSNPPAGATLQSVGIRTIERMTIQRMDHVGVVVDDLAAATEFFVELGLELRSEASVEGPLGGPHRGTRRRPDEGRVPADPGRPRTTRADQLPIAVDPGRQPARPGERAGSPPHRIRSRGHRHRRCQPAGPAARSSSASWSATRTATCSATSAARRGSSSSWPSGSADGRALKE